MIAIKIMESAESEHANIEEGDRGLLHGIVVMKELLKPWSNDRSEWIVCADSYFASVGAAKALKQLGFHFIGVVKTAMKQFPMAYLQSLELNAGRGDLRAVKSTDGKRGTMDMIAFVWVDRERRYFICNGAGLEAITPIYRTRWRQVDETPNADPARVQLEIPQPAATELYYSVCGAIDQINWQRQDDLEIERMLGCHDWSIRVNLSIFSMCAVDAYNVHFQCSGQPEIQDIFYSHLAEELINNNYDTVQLRPGVRVQQENPPEASPHLTPTKKKRKLKDGSETPYTSQGICKICSKKTTWICSSCKALDPRNSEPWYCHGKNRDRSCFELHKQQLHD